MKEELYDFGMVGLGVMGRNFILNVADNGFSTVGLDLDKEKVNALKEEAEDRKIKSTDSIKEFVSSLSSPRKIMLLVPAGKPVDGVIQDLIPLLDKGDLIIDGGNSYFTDTNRRSQELEEKGINFFGMGVSGGAEGARRGPSIMPGGPEAAYQSVKPIMEAVSAKVNGDPCVAYLGPKSAGNYVKMVHNGIEYGLMQLIAEAYDLLRNVAGLDNDEMQEVFTKWNEGRLQSFLVEITSKIFKVKDDESGRHLVDLILDKAKQKGTGKWTSQNAMDLGMPIPTIDMAVTMRELSSFKSERITIDSIYEGCGSAPSVDKEAFVSQVESALYFAFIITYAQGMAVLSNASEEYGYNLNLETVAKIWRGGCIIRAALLEDIMQAYKADPKLFNLITSPDFASTILTLEKDARKVISTGIEAGIPIAALSSTISYFDAFRSGRLPLNVVQAQRDFFGSHTYERVDKDGIFHTEWE
ncbi:NADP-dependent phosphogluconate dehydrogenase [Flexithrix dorotheae]|uniref:NADP-dependent phosphogluconate dehydrogenase n=1 Tax=Flexithrix dorotheae TaxID=70993 RepID=UPI0003820892|nr:NADP-dependent phosphogluconate dehydrogenase [Flexithrix dorotheae]